MNELLLIVEIIVIFVFLLYFCKQFRELGLIIWMILMSIISNILCLKIVNIFGFDISLGFVPYVSIFIAFNIYIQRCGIKNLYKIITCVILSLIFSYF
ncbi:MAG: hypothetical protein Q4G04_06995, partial [bacterium]|nr:hypothetical protein [bacterium]